MVARKRKDMVHYLRAFHQEHIEVSHSMTTDSFIMCWRRFIGRRGYARVITTDNGTNFVGASAELIESFQEMDHVKIGEFLPQHGSEWICWKRNPPLASNMGGVWERQIRIARNILSSLFKTHGASLTDESLHKLLTKVEAIVNSRHLTTDVINDVTSPVPLSPINLLTMKLRVVMPPPGIFTSADTLNALIFARIKFRDSRIFLKTDFSRVLNFANWHI